MKKAVVILAHGSKKEKAKNDLMQVVKALNKRTRVTIRLACMQLAQPSFEETINELANDNYSEIIIIPFFLTNGAHMQEDIPKLIKEAKQRHPQIQIRKTGYLWPDSSMIDLLEKRISAVIAANNHRQIAPANIEQESFAIIDDLITRNDLNQDELTVVKRLVHTSGDTSLANLITFTSNAITNGIEAINHGLPIITDVSMVEAGINKQLCTSLSIEIHQLIADEAIKEEAAKLCKTKAQVAIRKLALKYPQSIIAIGNAPTALLEVADLIKAGAINPALVIAMPVGFVGTVQSKEAIKKTSAEYICVEGTRGGSNLAAAAVNALLKISVNMPVTTGVCAAAVAKAAVYSLYSGEPLNEIEVSLPDGKTAQLGVFMTSSGSSSSTYYAIKPENNDPDITKKIKIFAQAKIANDLKIEGGIGIGKVTKPGLAQEVGQPAINPVPLKMIKDEITKVLPKSQGATITISAPDGAKLASKTFNERLGIIGGISILGTTGLVRPMSVDAYKISLSAQIDIALAAGFKEIAITPGNIGQKAALKVGFLEEAAIICSNFVGYMLDKSKEKGVKKITLIGHLGKMLKILDGHFNTHSKLAKLNLGLLSPYLSQQQIAKLNTANEAIGLLSKDNLNEIAMLINEKVQDYLKKQIKTFVYLINLQSEIIGASNE